MSFGVVPQQAVITLDSSGNGTMYIYNNNAAAVLFIYQLGVITSPTSSGCQCIIRPSGIGIADTSYFAGTGDTAQGKWPVQPGDYLQLDWTNGPANGQAIATYLSEEVF